MATFADLLGVEVFSAVGLLELLWHFTGQFAPAGDVGRHSDKAIAAALNWRKKPELLINSLVGAGWLDSVGTDDRLVVHDWPDHCEDAVHMRLARARRFFWNGSPPSFRRLPATERALAGEFYATSVRTKCASNHTQSALSALCGHGMVGHGMEGLKERKDSAAEILAKEPALPPEKPPEKPVPPKIVPLWESELIAAAIAIHKRHPKARRCSLQVVEIKLRTIVRPVPEEQKSGSVKHIDQQHVKWCESDEWTKESMAYAKSLEAWLNPSRRLWDNDPRAVTEALFDKRGKDLSWNED